MTATGTDVVKAFLNAAGHHSLALAVDLIAILLLLILTIEVELIRAYAGPSRRVRLHAFGVAILPLFVAFVFIVVSRAVGTR